MAHYHVGNVFGAVGIGASVYLSGTQDEDWLETQALENFKQTMLLMRQTGHLDARGAIHELKDGKILSWVICYYDTNSRENRHIIVKPTIRMWENQKIEIPELVKK